MTTETNTEPTVDFDDLTVSPSAQFFEEPASGEPDPEILRESYDAPDTSFVSSKTRSRKAVSYEKKVAGIFNTAFRVAITSPETVADAAALNMHAKPVSAAIGDLADADPRVERMVDFITSGTENPYASVLAATVPLILQLIRNHEPVLEPKVRGFKIPFGKRKGEKLTMKFGIRLRGVRNLTNDPDALESYVFDNPDIMAALSKQGLTVARSKPARG